MHLANQQAHLALLVSVGAAALIELLEGLLTLILVVKVVVKACV